MDFGLFVACHRFDDAVSTREVYDQAMEMVPLAEDAGFRTAWFPEHHLIHDISSPSPSPLLFAIHAAARTRASASARRFSSSRTTTHCVSPERSAWRMS